MLKSLNIPEEELSIGQRLLYICKKPGPNVGAKPQIDFLLLEKQIQQMQQLQSKVCQQIVQFVDEHRQQFIQINQKFYSIQQNVNSAELIIKKLLPKIDTYKSNLYSPQSKMQQFITNYEQNLMKQQLSEIAKEQADFLSDFVIDFEQLININVEDLSQRNKYHIVRFLRKKQYIKSIFDHPLLQGASGNINSLVNLVDNISQELQFYISQQLSRIAISRQLRNIQNRNLSILDQLKIWYRHIGKEQGFYQIIEESIVGKELSALQNFIVSHKQSLIVGKEENIVKEFFENLFNLVQQFPSDYPKQRILKIIYKFLNKKQLNFMYSYVVPTFPISYNAYNSALQKIKNQSLKKQLKARHGWNLKFWADLRIKSIMDRSGKQSLLNLNKWLEIVFKRSFMIYGVKNYMVKLAFLLVNRFCADIQNKHQQEKGADFSAKMLNDLFHQVQLVNSTLQSKLQQGFQASSHESGDQIKQQLFKQQINRIIQSVNTTLTKTLSKWIVSNMQMIINTCRASLEPYKSFVMKVISKKERHKGMLNSQQNILRPLHSYFKNNPQISPQCSSFIQKILLQQIQKFYDSQYAKQIYNYCNSNISTQQMKLVMEIVSLERQNLFQNQSIPQQ